jgi:hypothetical protein
MSDRFRLDVALYLADAASVGRKVTYGELCAKFGGVLDDWGPILAVIAGRLRKRGHPLLPVLVVAVETGQPIIDETNCRLWGLVGKEAIRLEQQRCFDFDWPSVFFQREKLFRNLPRAVLQAWNAMAETRPCRPSAPSQGRAAAAPRDAAGDQGRQVNPAKDLTQADLIRHQADKIVDEFPDDALGVLAADLESDTEQQEGLAIALAIATELRRRAAAGIRKWPGPNGCKSV